MDELLQKIEAEFGPKFDELNGKAADLAEQLETARDSDETEKVEEFSKALAELDETVKTLSADREDKLRSAEWDGMKAQLGTLTEALEQTREPTEGFSLGGSPAEGAKALYGPDTDHSFYSDVREFVKAHDDEAKERWEEALDGKAMTQSTGTAGGFLVPDVIANEVLQLREQRSVLRSLFPSIRVQGDTLRIASVTGGLVAGWVAELAEKPAADLTFGEISVNTFTAAGLAVASNQLLRNARRSVDGLVNRDLAIRLANLEEIAYFAGSGVGQPRGILNTPGVGTTNVATTTVLALLDGIVDAITSIYSNYFGAPNAIVMHPRTWGRIAKARESATSASYLVGPPSGGADARRPTDGLPGFGSGQVPRGELFGLPVYTTGNVPTGLGDAEDQSCVIVGNFSEGLILDTQGLTLDQSEHVYFTTNQTIFRAEEQTGFTASRYPKAFNVVYGDGLAGG